MIIYAKDLAKSPRGTGEELRRYDSTCATGGPFYSPVPLMTLFFLVFYFRAEVVDFKAWGYSATLAFPFPTKIGASFAQGETFMTCS